MTRPTIERTSSRSVEANSSFSGALSSRSMGVPVAEVPVADARDGAAEDGDIGINVVGMVAASLGAWLSA